MVSKRVLLDIQEIQKEEFQKSGIYYYYDDANITRGLMLIWGTEGTLYEDMPMCYSVEFPSGYPFDPPKVLFSTFDGKTRFHPNMYQNGKVCLSILGTWEGPKWASTLRLSTVAVTLQSLLDNNPIAHEPGYETRVDEYSTGYNELVGYRCIEYILDCLERIFKENPLSTELDNFRSVVKERYSGIIKRLEKRLEKYQENKKWVTIPYNLSGKTNNEEIKARIKKLGEVPWSTEEYLN
jgi:ubiquitin-conjugating enzyme E2 Z